MQIIMFNLVKSSKISLQKNIFFDFILYFRKNYFHDEN